MADKKTTGIRVRKNFEEMMIETRKELLSQFSIDLKGTELSALMAATFPSKELAKTLYDKNQKILKNGRRKNGRFVYKLI